MTTLAHDNPSIALSRAADRPASGGAIVSINVGDMHCAACASYIEESLAKQPGVTSAYVHFATQRARIAFDPARISKPELLEAIRAMGYEADDESAVDRMALTQATRRRFLWHFGLASLCAMQLMMLTVPRYLAGDELEAEFASLMDWGALALVLPVLLVAARSFYAGALREVRTRRIGMDSAVVFAVMSAFVGSCWHLWQRSGSLFFDSIAMFIALLLAVRWFEWEQRTRNRERVSDALRESKPRTVRRLAAIPEGASTRTEAVAASELRVGEVIEVRTGECLPVYCELRSDLAHCDESMLTGESAVIEHRAGDSLFAGSINCGPALLARVTATVEDSTEQRLLALADASCKPSTLRISERVARRFMPALMVAAAATFVIMLPDGVDLAFERAIAVVIISCPCALALAAPAAYARAFAILIGQGAIVRRDGALERLAQSNAFLLDKTGTLTEPSVEAMEVLRPELGPRECLTIIAALEQVANHPLARAIHKANDCAEHLPDVSDAQWIAGDGVSGTIGARQYRFGRASFVMPSTFLDVATSDDQQVLWLSDQSGAVCKVRVGESVKPNAHELVKLLRSRGSVEICSGDSAERVARIAHELGIDHWTAAQTPYQKARHVQRVQSGGAIVTIIGDGINDTLGFAGADVAIATSGATDITRASADFVALEGGLAPVVSTVRCSIETERVVKSNFVWAIGYNLVALPCAVLGMVNPLFAGVGMAASSAIVMLNVLRIRPQGTTA